MILSTPSAVHFHRRAFQPFYLYKLMFLVFHSSGEKPRTSHTTHSTDTEHTMPVMDALLFTPVLATAPSPVLLSPILKPREPGLHWVLRHESFRSHKDGPSSLVCNTQWLPSSEQSSKSSHTLQKTNKTSSKGLRNTWSGVFITEQFQPTLYHYLSRCYDRNLT